MCVCLASLDGSTGGKEENFFVCGGFATMDENSNLGITVSDAFDMNDLDANKNREQLAELQAQLGAESGTC